MPEPLHDSEDLSATAVRRPWSFAFAVFGFLLVSAGVLLNQWSLGKLLSPDGVIGSMLIRVLIWVFDVGCLILGTAVIRYRHRLRLPVPSLTNVAFLLVSTVAALLAAEAALRAIGHRPWTPGIVGSETVTAEKRVPYSVVHKTLGHTIQPGHIRINMPGGCYFEANHLENRTRATQPQGTASDTDPRPQIWIFGCSFTYGWGVEDHETFPWYLQEFLPRFRIINFGISGYSTLQAFMRFEEALSQYPPPTVAILAYASIQEERNVLSRSWKKNLAQYEELSFILHPYGRIGPEGRLVCANGGIVYRALPGVRHLAFMNAVDDAVNRLEVRLRRSRRVAQSIVEMFGRRARERGVRPLVVCLTDDPASRGILDHGRREGIPCLDVSVDLTEPRFTNLPHDPHPSALAHRHYATAICDFLMRDRE